MGLQRSWCWYVGAVIGDDSDINLHARVYVQDDY